MQWSQHTYRYAIHSFNIHRNFSHSSAIDSSKDNLNLEIRPYVQYGDCSIPQKDHVNTLGNFTLGELSGNDS